MFSVPAMRRGAFSPADLTDLVSWHDADDISTLWQDSARTTQVASNNDPVGAWDDKSGNANHLLQATVGYRPLYKTNTLNSKPTILGDGVDDFLTDTFTLTQPAHCFVIFRQETWTESDVILDGGSDLTMLLSQFPSTPDVTVYAGASLSSSDATIGTFFLGDLLYNSTSSHLQIADNAPVNGNAGTASPGGLSVFARASGFFSNSSIAEIVLCDAELTGSDLTDLRSYFNTKWGVTV